METDITRELFTLLFIPSCLVLIIVIAIIVRYVMESIEVLMTRESKRVLLSCERVEKDKYITIRG